MAERVIGLAAFLNGAVLANLHNRHVQKFLEFDELGSPAQLAPANTTAAAGSQGEAEGEPTLNLKEDLPSFTMGGGY